MGLIEELIEESDLWTPAQWAEEEEAYNQWIIERTQERLEEQADNDCKE